MKLVEVTEIMVINSGEEILKMDVIIDINEIKKVVFVNNYLGYNTHNHQLCWDEQQKNINNIKMLNYSIVIFTSNMFYFSNLSKEEFVKQLEEPIKPMFVDAICCYDGDKHKLNINKIESIWKDKGHGVKIKTLGSIYTYSSDLSMEEFIKKCSIPNYKINEKNKSS